MKMAIGYGSFSYYISSTISSRNKICEDNIVGFYQSFVDQLLCHIDHNDINHGKLLLSLAVM